MLAKHIVEDAMPVKVDLKRLDLRLTDPAISTTIDKQS